MDSNDSRIIVKAKSDDNKKISNNSEGKFMVTRSKRKYKKREMPVVREGHVRENSKMESCTKHDDGNHDNNQDEVPEVIENYSGENQQQKADDLQNSSTENLSEQVKQAKIKLDELNKIIQQKNEEISSLQNETVTTPVLYFPGKQTRKRNKKSTVKDL